jgi:hypothetical protein
MDRVSLNISVTVNDKADEGALAAELDLDAKIVTNYE